MSYLTQAEKERIALEWVGRNETLGWTEVSTGMMSLARFSGGTTVQGHHYTYLPEHDELWRDDVLKMVHDWRRTDAMAKELPAQVQGELL